MEEIEEIFSSSCSKPAKMNLTNNEKIEIIKESNKFSNLLNINISNDRWLTYIEMSCWSVSNRHIKSRKMFIGAIILNNMTFFWDDLEDKFIEFNKHILLENLYEICEKYYEEKYIKNVFEASKQWVDHDAYFRSKEIRKLLCSNLHTYWQYRLIDSGLHYWMKITAPIYKNEEYSTLVDIMILSQLLLKPFMIVNDICSYYKEKYYNECSNFLNITNDINSQINDIKHNIKCIKNFNKTISEILLDKIYGHYIWSNNTKRYKKNISSINNKLYKTEN